MRPSARPRFVQVVENSPVPAGKRPIHFLPLLGVLLAGQLLGANPGLDARRVGIYHWGGRISRSVAQGVDAIADVGARVVRITLSPRYLRDYNMATNCVAGFSLQSAATDPEIDRALSRSNIDVVMITAYDGTSFGDCETHRFLNPDFFTTEHRAAVVAEYSDSLCTSRGSSATLTSGSSSPHGRVTTKCIAAQPINMSKMLHSGSIAMRTTPSCTVESGRRILPSPASDLASGALRRHS